MTAINRMEVIKKERNGLDAIQDIYRYAQEGLEFIDEEDFDRFKWYGLYRQRPKTGYFMIRVNIPGGQYNSRQMRVLAEIAKEYAQGFGDVTTRQTFQFHWLKIQDIPEIFQRLKDVGLSTLGGGGDTMRNITGCPVAGRDQKEIFNAQPEIIQITRHFLGNRKYSNLPRKFKLSISACGIDCCLPQVNCVSFVGVPHGPEGVTKEGYNLYLGGGLAKSPHLAEPVNIFLRRDQVLEAAIALMDIYREFGDREHRGRARLKFLMDDWGPEKFREEIAKRLSFTPYPASPHRLPDGYHDHLGIFPQNGNQLYYLGLTVPTGRIKEGQMSAVADIADKYGSGFLANTIHQNLVILDIPAAKVEAAAEKIHSSGLFLDELSVKADCVVCTGKEFCNLAMAETKALMKKVIHFLEENLIWDRHIKIYMNGCPNSCARHHIADIGLQGTLGKINHGMIECFDFYVGGGLGEDAGFARKIASRIKAEEVPMAVMNLVKAYQANRRNKQNFRSWCNRQSDEELSRFLGFQ